ATVDSQRSARSPPATMTTGSDISAEKVGPGEDQPLVHGDTSADAEKLQLRDSFEEGDDDSPPKRVGWQHWLIYAIFVIQGVGILLPWNMFLTIAPSYYINYKLNPNPMNVTDPSHRPYYQKHFFSYLGLFSQLPNLLLNILNVLNVFKGGLTARIYVCIAVILLIVGVTDAFALVDTTT
ncbi:nucleoside transporter, partial [Aphelenchoides avenae]